MIAALDNDNSNTVVDAIFMWESFALLPCIVIAVM